MSFHAIRTLSLLSLALVAAPRAQARTAAAPVSPAPVSLSQAGLGADDQALVPLGRVPTPEEDRALARAIDGGLEGCAAFCTSDPDSPWAASVNGRLGLTWLRMGRLERAVTHLEKAWSLSRDLKDARGRAFADEVVGQLADLMGSLGRADRLGQILAEVKGRPMKGLASDRILLAKEAYAQMIHRPERTFRCGMEALGAMALALGRPVPVVGRLTDHVASREGTRMDQLLTWGNAEGLDLVAVKRVPGAPLPTPSIIHWKAGHFSLLDRVDGGACHVQGFLHGTDQIISRQVLEEELSDVLLVPRPSLDPVTGAAPPSALASLWGKGNVDGTGASGPGGPKTCPTGMPVYGLIPNSASLRIFDRPVPYQPPFGPSVDLGLAYDQRDAASTYSGGRGTYQAAPSPLGSKWTFLHVPSLGYYWVPIFGSCYNPKTGSWETCLMGFEVTVLMAENGGSTNFGQIWVAAPQSDYQARQGTQSAKPAHPEFPALRSGCAGAMEPSRARSAGGGRGPAAQARVMQDPGWVELPSRNTKGDVLAVHVVAGFQGLFYETRRFMPDGSMQAFDGNGHITQATDSYGQTVSYQYGPHGLERILDAAGGVTVITYGANGLVSRITEPGGRSADLTYNDNLQLSSITDVVGMTSSFIYGPTATSPDAAADFINAMTTPYGTSTFSTGTIGADRWIEASDPMGHAERMEFRSYTSGMEGHDTGQPPNSFNLWLEFRNTYHWDKRAYANREAVLGNAEIYHWLHSDYGLASSLEESHKKPLERRIWFSYGQTDGQYYREGPSSVPTQVGQVLPDLTFKVTTTDYNLFGNPVRTVDPVGRETTQVYSSDGLDLLETRNTTNGQNLLLASYSYDGHHRPLTVTDASGQTTTFTYNSVGQVLSTTNPKGEMTSFGYDGGRLTSVTSGGGTAVTTFAYDDKGRISGTVTSDGISFTTAHDDLDRPTTVTFPDGTTEVKQYRFLDVVASKDRLGRWTYMEYNPIRQLMKVTDPQGRTTRLDWCGCGSLEQLTDPAGQITNWVRDIQSRVVEKRLHDRTSTSYTYDSVGRLASRQDAMGQITRYEYFADGNLGRVSYENARHATPPVAYAYDPAFNRLTTMVDQFGTTTYEYYPITQPAQVGGGRLAAVTSPLPNSRIAYTYDELGRVVNRDINGSAESRQFDTLGRLSTVTNPLGAFNYAYDGASSRLAAIFLPNGQQTLFSYFDAANGFRLKEIRNQKSDATPISVFGYTYDATGQIKTWSQQSDAQLPKVFTFGYDDANQLTSAVLGGPNGEILKQYAYGYDLAGNRTSETIDGNTTTSDHNSVNQLIAQRSMPNTAARAVSPGKPAQASKATGRTKAKAAPSAPSKSSGAAGK